MASPPKPIITHNTFFSKSNQIVNANNLHFFSLSSLFFLPLFISLFSFIISNPFSFTSTSIPLYLLYTLLLLSLYIAAVATTTHSIHRALQGKPLNLSSAINSLSNSFFPLASTTLTSIAILLLDSIIFFLFLSTLLKFLAFDFNYTLTFTIIVLLFLVSFHIILTIAAVISVVESKWWLDPLRMSFSLVKGMKQSSFILLLIRGISIWVLVLGVSTQIYTIVDPWSYVSVLSILYVSGFWTILMGPLVNSYAVLYLNCKEFHEESGFDVAVEVSKECVSLAIDDDKKLVHESNVKILVFLAALMAPCATLVVWLQ